MKHPLVFFLACIGICSVLACAPAEPAFEPEIPEIPEIPLGLDPAFLAVPAGNPMTAEKVALGWQLYYDPRLSVDGSVSCATCHDPAFGFADPGPVSTGVGGQHGNRNSPTVINAAFSMQQFWDGRAATLEEQALGPIANPVEMANTVERVVATLDAIPGYRRQFQRIFGADEVTPDMVAKAIASFERVILSGNSSWDQWIAYRETGAISDAALRGETLFRGKAGCSQCHMGFNFSDATVGRYHNIGVGMQGDQYDEGRGAVTAEDADHGAFKTPTLRNVAETSPYMHDGSLATLEEVIDYYAQGGTPNAWLDPKISQLELTADEKADLVAFLEALTGEVPEFATRAPRLPPGTPPSEREGDR